MYKRIEDLNQNFLNVRVKTINAKYEQQFREFTEKHLKDLEGVDERVAKATEDASKEFKRENFNLH